jgi:hypothetical protein
VSAPIETIDDLGQKELARLVVDMFHRVLVHYAFWFTEVRHQLGPDTALDTLAQASERSRSIQLKRLGQALGFEVEQGIPVPLLKLERSRLLDLLDKVAINWLANDGVWFQAVEFGHGMNDAKRCNDSCWAQFSPFEAWAIKRFLELPAQAGLEGLRKALSFRLYARINRQSFNFIDANCLEFSMVTCRVQGARQRKGLDDYPCKSGGMVEYDYFARSIDSRIRTTCVGCPPDAHPSDWFCRWRFELPNAVSQAA